MPLNGKMPDDLPEQRGTLILSEKIRPLAPFVRDVPDDLIRALAREAHDDSDKGRAEGGQADVAIPFDVRLPPQFQA